MSKTRQRQGNKHDDDVEASLEIQTVTTMTIGSLEATMIMMAMSRKPRMLMTITLEARTVTMVNLEASVMTKTGDALNVKGFKLSQSSQISTYGTSGLAMLTSHGFVKCERRTLFSDCRNLVGGTAKSAKAANSGSNTDFHSLTSVIGADISSM